MKVRIDQTLPKFCGGHLDLLIKILPEGKEPRKNPFGLDDRENNQVTEPVRAIGYYERETNDFTADDALVFVYRNRVVVVEPPYEISPAEIILTVKHVVLSQEQTFADMRSDIERFQRLKEAGRTPREPIPGEIRSFVWGRDQGRCVRCNSVEKLEFDHIIPLAKGGSNTERNIQLLCEACNRSKGTTI